MIMVMSFHVYRNAAQQLELIVPQNDQTMTSTQRAKLDLFTPLIIACLHCSPLELGSLLLAAGSAVVVVVVVSAAAAFSPPKSSKASGGTLYNRITP